MNIDALLTMIATILADIAAVMRLQTNTMPHDAVGSPEVAKLATDLEAAAQNIAAMVSTPPSA